MAIYDGLGRTARFRIVVVAAIIATANLAMGWYLCVDFQKQFYFTAADAKLVEDVTLKVRGSNSDPNASLLAIRMLDNLSHLKAIVNKQSVLVLAISSGFALFAIGFALFLIGADGAFTLAAEQGNSKFALTSAAPGILCFVLAAALIGISVTRKHELGTGSVRLAASAGSVVSPEVDPCTQPNPPAYCKP